MQLPFGLTPGFRECCFDYTPSSLSFYVDGQLVKTWTDCLPQNSMKLYVNLLSPTWREGKRP
jgi:beta-glucanase (GH16 family)